MTWIIYYDHTVRETQFSKSKLGFKVHTSLHAVKGHSEIIILNFNLTLSPFFLRLDINISSEQHYRCNFII